MAKPGIMVYFDDVLPSLQCLTTEDAGRLFIAMLQYGQNGTIPNFGDSIGLNIAWNFIRPKIDRDNASYDEAVLKSQYGVYKRETKRHGEAPLDFDEWCQTQSSTSQTPSSPIMGTSSPSKTPSSPIMGTYLTAISNQELEMETELEKQKEMESAEGMPTAPALAKAVRKQYGQYGWVKLSDKEYIRLSNDLGQAELERCIAYIDEAAQSTGNKNKWQDWNLVIRRCHRDGWGLKQSSTRHDTRNEVKTAADYESGDDFFAR